MNARILLVLQLVAGLGMAQTSAVATGDLSRGTTLLPGSGAFGDDATSLTYNPAGLAHVGSFSAVYLHERSNTRSLNNDALFLGASLGDFLGLGLGFESLRPSGGTPRAKTSFGFSLGSDLISTGLTFNWFSGAPVEGLITADLGLQSRPLRWLSVGAGVRNLNAPKNASTVFDREYSAGLGVRPFGERLTLGIDVWLPERAPELTTRMQYTAQWKVIDGLSLMAGASHGFTPSVPLAFQAGLGIDFGHVGYTQGVSYSGGQFNWQFVGRFSADQEASIVPRHTIAVMSLADISGSTTGTLGALLGVAEEDRYLKFLRFLGRASEDPTLAGVVLKLEGASIGMARADEVRTGILKLRKAGKKVFAYALQTGDTEYLIASACDAVYAAPDAALMVDGLHSTVQFLGGTAELLGITVDVARVGAYKNFPDQFTRSSMSDEHKEALNAYLDTVEKTVSERVTSGRKLTVEQWKAIVDEGMKPVARAQELKEIDEVLTPALFEQRVKAEFPGASASNRYRPNADRDFRWGARPEIAIIPVLGNISGGSSQANPLLGASSGAETFIQSLNAAAEDSDVKAIVIRVDSGGGDALASDLMYRAVLEAKKRKPIVASMGDVAASGGYYVAMGADQVFASSTTLTGSIGIFFVKPAVKKLANGLGVAQESTNRGRLAGMFDLYEPWTDEQRAAAQKWVDAGYDLFITEVAAARKLTKPQVDAVARGRVWSGEDAKARGLVDDLGGLMDAIAAARAKAGVSDGDVRLRIWQPSPGLLGGLVGATLPEALLESPVKEPALPAAVNALMEKVGANVWMLEPGLQARVEYDVRLR